MVSLSSRSVVLAFCTSIFLVNSVIRVSSLSCARRLCGLPAGLGFVFFLIVLGAGAVNCGGVVVEDILLEKMWVATQTKSCFFFY